MQNGWNWSTRPEAGSIFERRREPSQVQLYDCGWIGKDPFIVYHSAIDQDDATPGDFFPIAAMNMTEDMQLRSDPTYRTEQVLTSAMLG